MKVLYQIAENEKEDINSYATKRKEFILKQI